MTPEERRAANDRLVVENVKRYGCHVISVFDPDGVHPTFSYSVGIQGQTGAPEAIVIGVRADLGHSMINEYNDQIRRGVAFHRGQRYRGFLDGFDIYVEPARTVRLRDYTLGCHRYYKDAAFAVVQLIYPTTAGVWPWQEAASDWFRANQPMFGRKHPYRR